MKAGVECSIPVGIILKRFYCYKCGSKLKKTCETSTATNCSKEWWKYSNVGTSTLLPIGDIQVSEYKLKCPKCNIIIEYDTQKKIAKKQKKLKRKILSYEELTSKI